MIVSSSPSLEEILVFHLELDHADLAIYRDDVDHCPQTVCELCDLLSANVPTHTVALGLQLGDVDYAATGLHFEGCGE